MLEYGCYAGSQAGLYPATNFVADDLEFNPIREKKPDGTGIASFVDLTRGRLNDIPAGIASADEAVALASYNP